MPVRPNLKDPNGVLSGASAGAWKGPLPQVAGWLCDASYPDGTPVGPVQLQLRREGTLIRATLKISDQGGLKASAIETTPQDALLALDLLLSGPEVPWEVDVYPLAAPKVRRK